MGFKETKRKGRGLKTPLFFLMRDKVIKTLNKKIKNIRLSTLLYNLLEEQIENEKTTKRKYVSRELKDEKEEEFDNLRDLVYSKIEGRNIKFLVKIDKLIKFYNECEKL